MLDQDRHRRLEEIGHKLVDNFMGKVRGECGDVSDVEARILYQYVADIFARAAVSVDQNLHADAEDELGTVEMHGGYWFTCDHCGRDNFEREMMVSSDRDEQAEVAREVGAIGEFDDLPEDIYVVMTRMPRVVRCAHCSEEAIAQYDRESMILTRDTDDEADEEEDNDGD